MNALVQIGRMDGWSDGLYCGKIFVKLTHHLLVSHSTELHVIDCFGSAKKSSERSSQIRKLRKKGNYIHNKKVLNAQEGSLLVCRRPTKHSDPSEFLPCPHCYGFFWGKVVQIR